MALIWDPLRKKEVAATPEERVRQWFIIQLREAFGVPEHMMMSEVGFTFGRKAYRADIVVSGRDGVPLAVVECKRPEVELTPAVLEQAMRYNSVLGVRFLMVTNGKKTYLYRLEGERFIPFDHVPSYEEMLCPQ
ncbi:MAG: type I restriction enzyme HsdR N-terminal domain-containing protein [Bacteroidales bacterium]|nr:type I restriction enzyme HsdR N-terminal domain-containing protein [Bacteroidales bacterium]